MNRRSFLKMTSIIPIMVSESCHANNNISKNLNSSTQKFVQWLKPLQSTTAQGLFPYMETKNATCLSIVASAKLLLFFLRIGDIDSATVIGNGLVYWQKRSQQQGSKFAKGGLPTEIYLNSNQPLGDYYYASDNLLSIHALDELYKVTNNGSFAETALSIGHWFEQNLLDGVRHSLWKTNYGPAMHYLTSKGAFDNTIHGAGDFLWLVALKDLHALESNHGWQQRLAKAINFMQDAQMSSGAWFTYFQPDKNKTAGKWYGYRGDDITIGDDNLRSALAAQHFGMTKQEEQFTKWLQPYDDVMLWGYLNTQKSSPKFLPSDTPYFDVVCTGLLRTWYRRRGQNDLANKCQNRLDSLQASDGGWYWAAKQSNLKPLNNEKAIITGCWALVDIL